MAIHREEFLYVAHVDHESALIAWGAFYLERRESKDHDPPGSFRFKLLDDEELKKPGRIPDGIRPRGSIGRNTTPFGSARLLVHDLAGLLVLDQAVPAATFVWVHGLQPNTHYRYRVEVGGVEWATKTSDLVMKDENDGLATPDLDGRSYGFTTFPAPEQPSGSFTFAVIGDPGTGKEEQIKLGKALADLIDSEGIRFVLTLGDNIYMKPRSGGLLGLGEKVFRTIAGRMRMTGDEDDDWFTSYFLPYRDVISRVAVFPCLGNHDSENSEEDDDLAQLVDNLFLEERFPKYATEWRLGDEVFDTMFYRFRFGRDAEFVAVDTSFTDKQEGAEAIFEVIRGKRQPPLGSVQHRQFLDELLAEPAPLWRIPFGHHPAYSLGPSHHDNLIVQTLAQRFAKASPGRPLVWLAGHEHNFQHHREDQVHHLLSGAAGKCSELKKVKHPPAHACCHNNGCHFLLVTVSEAKIKVRLIDQDGHQARLNAGAAFPAHKGDEIEIDGP
jgi:tartrate-resistant acid phosphatase type 5